VHRARRFEGNPIVLGIVVGGLLLVGLVFGVFTIRHAYREGRR
jgi:hypothetical protein